jgi:hypothetical protein
MHKRAFLSIIILSALALTGCPPEDAGTDLGESGVLRFSYHAYSYVLGNRLATGSSAQLDVDTDDPVAFSSAVPAIVEITPQGVVTAVAPGSAHAIASDEGGDELDRIEVTVADATEITIEDGYSSGAVEIPAIFPGFEYRVGLRRSDALGTLIGMGGFEVTSTEGLAVRTARDDEEDFRHAGNTFVVSGSTPGTEMLTVGSASATATQAFRIAGADEIDAVEVHTSPWRSGGGPDNVAVRIGVQASSGGQIVAGAPCVWTVEGATIGLDGVMPGGEVSTDFWTSEPSFSATCTIGSASRTFDVVIADLPE